VTQFESSLRGSRAGIFAIKPREEDDFLYAIHEVSHLETLTSDTSIIKYKKGSQRLFTWLSNKQAFKTTLV